MGVYIGLVVRLLCLVGYANMKKILLTLLLVLISISQSNSATVNRIVGLNADCGNACQPIPLSVTVLCQAPSFCSRVVAPDWTNEQRFYGTDGTNCRVSNDGGFTWSNCVSNPSATAIYLNYAVAKDGSIIAIANDQSMLRVKRSIDGTVTWSTVFETSITDGAPGGLITPNVKLRCSRYSSMCVYPYRDSLGNTKALTSTDNGATWTETLIGGVNSIAYGNGPFVLTSSPTSEIGMWFPLASDGVNNYKAVLFTNGIWSLGSIVPTNSGGLCNWDYVINGNRRAICHAGVSGTTYEVRNEAGTVINTFTLPDVPSDNGQNAVGLSISVRPTGIWLLRGTAAGRTGLWVSNDSGASFVKIFETDTAGLGIGNQGSIYEGVNGCIYASWIVPGSSTIIRVC
jgi:hypothetical protein